MDEVSSLEDYLKVSAAHENSKADIISAFELHAGTNIAVKLAQPATPISQALKDFRRERVLFNGVPFIPDKSDSHRNIAFSLTLQEYITRMQRCYPGCDMSMRPSTEEGDTSFISGEVAPAPVTSESSSTGKTTNYDEDLTEAENSQRRADAAGAAGLLDLRGMSSNQLILQRSCRTSAGADSFFMIQCLFASVPGTIVTQRTNILGFVPFVNGEPPLHVDLFAREVRFEGDSRPASSDKVAATSVLVNMELVARIKVSNSFAIYDEDVINHIAGDDTDPPPWLELETIITDDMNFRTGEQHRVLRVQVYCPATDTYFPPLFS